MIVVRSLLTKLRLVGTSVVVPVSLFPSQWHELLREHYRVTIESATEVLEPSSLVDIRKCHRPRCLVHAAQRPTLLTTRRDAGGLRLQNASGFTRLCRDGTAEVFLFDDVEVCPEPDSAYGLFEVALWHAAAGFGAVPLHAAAFKPDVSGVLVLGRRGSGKSTLAAAALAAEWPVIADDSVWVQAKPDGQIWARSVSKMSELQGANRERGACRGARGSLACLG